MAWALGSQVNSLKRPWRVKTRNWYSFLWNGIRKSCASRQDSLGNTLPSFSAVVMSWTLLKGQLLKLSWITCAAHIYKLYQILCLWSFLLSAFVSHNHKLKHWNDGSNTLQCQRWQWNNYCWLSTASMESVRLQHEPLPPGHCHHQHQFLQSITLFSRQLAPHLLFKSGLSESLRKSSCMCHDQQWSLWWGFLLVRFPLKRFPSREEGYFCSQAAATRLVV